MRVFGPERSNVCDDIGAPHTGHGRSVRTGSGVLSYGPTEAGPASRMSREFTHEYHRRLHGRACGAVVGLVSQGGS